MTTYAHWTIDAVEEMPKVAGERYEIIDGELFVTTQPHGRHQATSENISFELGAWSRKTSLGRVFPAPGIVYAPDQAVAPDLVWVKRSRVATIIAPDGKMHESPELVIEILSPGKANEERDREKKLEQYSRYGVQEYWIADWRAITVEIYRQDQDALRLMQTLKSGDELTSPLLPGFTCVIDRFFEL